MKEKLAELREKIDRVDDEILKLIMERLEYVREVGELKNRNSSRIYVPERENSIFTRVWKRANEITENEKIEREELAAIYTEIISFCRAKERKVSAAVENDKCFFIAGKIFGNCIEIMEPEKDEFWNAARTCEKDFLVIELEEKNLSEIFREKKYIYITAEVDFSGKNYIILGKEPNGLGEETWTAFLIRKGERIEFIELKGCLGEEEAVERIVGKYPQGSQVKFLGHYEKRKF